MDVRQASFAGVTLLGLLFASTAHAGPVNVRYQEGVTRGFPVLRALADNEKLAQGDYVQVANGDRVATRLVFRFKDGSIHDETVVFSQRNVFTLLLYRLVQKGPSFPETLEATIDRETARYDVRYRPDEDSAEEHLSGKFEIPDDAYNGMISMIVKNLAPGAGTTVSIVAFTPKPRVVQLQLLPTTEERAALAEAQLPATRYQIRPQLGLFASLLVTDIPDYRVWVVPGEAPAFLKAEGPLYFMGPIWRIDPY